MKEVKDNLRLITNVSVGSIAMKSIGEANFPMGLGGVAQTGVALGLVGSSMKGLGLGHKRK